MANYSMQWGHTDDFIKTTVNVKGQEKCVGALKHNFCKFQFSVTRQENNKYVYRGKVKAVDEFGKVVIDRGKKVEKSLYIVKEGETEIKIKVEEKVAELFTEHSRILLKNLDRSIRPDTIIPAIAAVQKAKEYAEFRHYGSTKRVIEAAERSIKRTCGLLPVMPMCEFSKKKLNKYFNAYNVSASAIKELHNFWAYCIDNGICVMHANPVEKDSKKKKSKVRKIDELLSKVQLSLTEIDVIFDKLEEINNSSAMGCGLLFSGVPSRWIEKLTWGDLIFMDAKCDYVILKLHMEKRRGATHNFSRPLLPRTAALLKMRYDQLLKLYGETAVNMFPVISQRDNLEKRISMDQVYGLAERLIVDTEILTGEDIAQIKKLDLKVSPVRRICVATYESLLVNVCNLSEDTMIFKFLRGMAFDRDTTLDNYTAMASPAGWEMMYTCMAPLCKTKINIKQTIHNNQQIVAEPETNRHVVKVAFTLKAKYGDEVSIRCDHGVRGTVTVK